MTASSAIGRGLSGIVAVVPVIPVIVVALLSGGCSENGAKAPGATPATAAPPAAADPGAHSVVGKAPAAVNGIVSVIVLEPQTPREFQPPAERPLMDQVTQTFVPAILFVRTGQPTDFKNSDDVLHNVRVREDATKSGTFNVAIPTGQIYTHTFERDGFYDVGCDIHPGMAAQVIATSSPYAILADAAGNFSFENVEPGAYRVTIYSGLDTIEKTIEVAGAVTTVGE